MERDEKADFVGRLPKISTADTSSLDHLPALLRALDNGSPEDQKSAIRDLFETTRDPELPNVPRSTPEDRTTVGLNLATTNDTDLNPQAPASFLDLFPNHVRTTDSHGQWSRNRPVRTPASG